MPAVTGNNFYIDKHDLHFRTGTANVATINYDTSRPAEAAPSEEE